MAQRERRERVEGIKRPYCSAYENSSKKHTHTSSVSTRVEERGGVNHSSINATGGLPSEKTKKEREDRDSHYSKHEREEEWCKAVRVTASSGLSLFIYPQLHSSCWEAMKYEEWRECDQCFPCPREPRRDEKWAASEPSIVWRKRQNRLTRSAHFPKIHAILA